jgi:hypothetical protein
MKANAPVPVKITALEIENIKRVRAVSLDCTAQALTVIGGKNGQGKTSILDTIMWLLGGDRYRPSQPIREGAEEGYAKITMDNGLTVERRGKNSSLKVTSADGKGGQALLNQFVNAFALDLPRFMQATGKEKAQKLLDSFPTLGPELQRLNAEAKSIFEERHAIGVIADRKAKYASELPFDPSAPDKPLSGADMAARMQAALSANARNDALRHDAARARDAIRAAQARVAMTDRRVNELKAALEEAALEAARATADLDRATTSAAAAAATAQDLTDQDTTSIKKELEQIDSLNARVRANESKRNAEAEAEHLKENYQALTDKLETVRTRRLELLASVTMPLPGLSIDEEAELVFNGQRWDCMSGSEQLRVATAISAAMKPECGFVLLDKLEVMDTETLHDFGAWLQTRNLQAIGSRVSVGEECSIIIDDGAAKEDVDAPIRF